jgi:phenylalanyl-tRNA synthetase beta chain
MLVPISWLKDFVDIDIAPELLAERLTLAGLEVAHIRYIGIPQGHVEGVRWPESDHLVWDREKLLLGAIREVKPHPDADRLVLAMVDYGGAELEQCVTGAPNLFEYSGQGELDSPLWTAFAAEGAEVWDGHSDTPQRMILKGRKLRGIHNKSMVCSEKELGLSDAHEGVILMQTQPTDRAGTPYPAGTPLQEVFGDIVFDIELTPNLARCFSILGVAREVAALLDHPLKEPSYDFVAEGAPIAGEVSIDIQEPELNPRFTLALLRDTTVQESPDWLQRRLTLVGQRPINNIVDVTNYITFEIGQPLHAFDFDKLKARVQGNAPTIITRLPEDDETLETLDEVSRKLEPHNILVCDEAGVLSLGGLIGGAETEISDETTTVLLEAANWNFINIRQTMQSQKIFTDAGTRFSRGVHPSQAIQGLGRGIELMRRTGGGQVAEGVIDAYAKQATPVTVHLHVSEIERLLGVPYTVEAAADILSRLQFDVMIKDDTIQAVTPDFRMDIDPDPIIGQADLIEEIARIDGYDNIPNTTIRDQMAPQFSNLTLEYEETLRDLLVSLGLRETISYRFTTPAHEDALVPDKAAPWDDYDYVHIANPISSDKTVLRKSLLTSLLENALNNQRYNERQQIFEIGSVYWKTNGQPLPQEPRRLGILITGPRDKAEWMGDHAPGEFDFYDLKGVIEGITHGMHLQDVHYERSSHPTFHPGRAAAVKAGEQIIGTFGELHPLVARKFELTRYPVLIAEIDLDGLLGLASADFSLVPLPITPPILEDIALIVPEDTRAEDVRAVLVSAGGDLLKDVVLFDVYQGDSIPTGTKSLAYSLTYQTDERTLKDKEVAKLRNKIVKAAEKQLGAKLRA